MTTYKQTEIRRTNITTDVRSGIGYLYELSGDVSKTAGHRPFLTSIKACREYINSVLAEREEREAA